MIGVALVILAAAMPNNGWQMIPSHWAFAGETPEHLKSVASACHVEMSLIVAVPEQRIPPAFAVFGVRLPADVAQSSKDCFLAKAWVTKSVYNSAAEADPNN